MSEFITYCDCFNRHSAKAVVVYIGLEETNWIPHSFQEGAKNLTKEAVEYFARPNQVIGLGSGPIGLLS